MGCETDGKPREQKALRLLKIAKLIMLGLISLSDLNIYVCVHIYVCIVQEEGFRKGLPKSKTMHKEDGDGCSWAWWTPAQEVCKAVSRCGGENRAEEGSRG